MLLVPAWTPFRLWTGEWPDYFEMIEGLWWLNQPLITNKACTRISINAQHWILMQRGSNSRRPHKMPFLSATTRCWGCISHGLTRAPLRCPTVCKKCFHAITPWALILYFNVVYTKLWPHHPEVATERETPQTRQHFPVFCSFILNLIWTTGNLRLNWCCNWKLLHHKLAGNSSCCDLTCNYISHKCKRCRSLWRCIKMGFQLS